MTSAAQAVTRGAPDRAAFARLVDEHRSAVCSIALAIVGDISASEDVAQDVFVAAWQGLGKLRNAKSVGPWLRQITRNRAIDRVRRGAQELSVDPAAQSTVEATGDDAETIVLAAERDRIVAATLDGLPDDSREVVLLFYREGRSIRHVAELLELSQDAIKKRLSRARAAIRAEVAERFADGVRDSAPTAAFTAAVMAAVSVSAPSAAGAVSVAAAVGAGKALKVAALGSLLLGPLLGIAGVLAGMRSAFARAATPEETRSLRYLALVAIAHVLVFGAMFSLVGRRPLAMWTCYAAFIGGFALIYLVWMPRIIAKRQAAERATCPTAAARHRRQRIYGLVGLVGGALAGGAAIWFALAAAGS